MSLALFRIYSVNLIRSGQLRVLNTSSKWKANPCETVCEYEILFTSSSEHNKYGVCFIFGEISRIIDNLPIPHHLVLQTS